MAPEVILRVTDLEKRFPRNGGSLSVLDGISFEVRRGDLISIVGPSGCGKTTLLEILARLQEPTSGSVVFSRTQNNDDLHSDISLIVFQQYNRSLYPFMSVASNVRFALDAIEGLPRSEKDDRIDEALRVTGLSSFASYYPWELSGGMQQRVALARAIAVRPMTLLLDEAFGSLDTQTRANLEDELLGLAEKYGLTVLYVTHDIDSAVYFGQRIMALSALPTQVLTLFDNEIPFPRNQIETRRDERFLAYREQLFTLLKNEKERITETE